MIGRDIVGVRVNPTKKRGLSSLLLSPLVSYLYLAVPRGALRCLCLRPLSLSSTVSLYHTFAIATSVPSLAYALDTHFILLFLLRVPYVEAHTHGMERGYFILLFLFLSHLRSIVHDRVLTLAGASVFPSPDSVPAFPRAPFRRLLLRLLFLSSSS